MEEACEYVMVVIDNPGITVEDLRPHLEKIATIEKIDVLRQIYNSKFINICVALVKFDSADTASLVLHSDINIPNCTIFEIDSIFLSKILAILYDLPKISDYEVFAKTLSNFGAQSMRLLSPTSPMESFGVMLAFTDRNKYKAFKHSIHGLVISGRNAQLIPLRPINNVSPVFKNMSNVLKSENNFDFTIRHFDKVYRCWKGSAYALSSVIAKAIDHNKSLKEFDAPNVVGPFKYIEYYLQGQEIDITVRNCPFLLKMSEQLQMESLFKNCLIFLEKSYDPISCCNLLLGFDDVGYNINKYSNIVAEAFETIKNESKFKSLPAKVLNSVISSESFNPVSEQSFFKWVMSFAESSPEKFKLLIKQVKIDVLDKNSILEFLNLSHNLIDLNDFRLPLLRLAPKINFSSNSDKKEVNSIDNSLQSFHRLFAFTVYNYDGVNKLNGILNYFITKCPIAPNGLPSVVVSASSEHHGKPEYVLSNTNDYFATQDMDNSWIRFTINFGYVIINGYSVQAYTKQGNMGSIRLSGSVDGVNWDILNEQKPNYNRTSPIDYYQVTDKQKAYRIIELKQISKNSMGYNTLSIEKFEIFGSIK